MKKVLYSMIFCLSVISSASFAGLNGGQVGTVDVQLQQIKAINEAGFPVHKHKYIKQCKRLYKQYIGAEIKNQYYINPRYSDLDNAIFDSQNVTLHPLGIAGEYSFLSGGIPASLSALEIERISFTTDNEFKNFNSDILFQDPLHPSIHCLLTGSGNS